MKPAGATAFNEMFAPDGATRSGYEFISAWLNGADTQALALRQAEAELLFRRTGITFAVYGEAEAEERIIPFDIIPRVINHNEWERLTRGLTQRVKALNAFLADIYGAGEILRAGIVPPDLIYRNPYFRPEMAGIRVAHDIYVQIAGIDIVRVDDEDFYVLEDTPARPPGSPTCWRTAR